MQMEHSLNALRRRLDGMAIDSTPENLRTPLGDKTVACEAHGDYVSTGTRYLRNREIWTPCPDCEEARMAAQRKAEAEKRAKAAQERMEQCVSEALIPRRFVGRTFDAFVADTPEKRHALTVCSEWAQAFDSHLKCGSSLILLGKPGTGKSHLAGAILQAIMPAHVGMYTTAGNVIRMVRSTWRRDSDRSEGEVLSIYGGVPLLVVDEIGVQYGTDGEQNILFEVLDRRYRDMLPTILLANQSKDGLKQFLGERAYDRLTETGRIVAFEWESYRPHARLEVA